MNVRLPTLALALLMASPVAAEQVSLSLCEAAIAKLKGGNPGVFEASSPALSADGCVFRDVRFLPYGVERGVSLKARSVTIGGRGFDMAEDGWISFDALSVSVDELRFVPVTGDPAMNWLFDVQNARNGIDVDLMAERQGEGPGWEIQKLTAVFPGDGNRIDFNARIDRLDLSSKSAVAVSGPTSRLMSADLTIETHGLFEAYALMALGAPLMGRDEDPAAAFEGMKATATDIVGKLDEASVPSQSKEALRAVISELPNPSGKLTLTFASENGFSSANFVPVILAGFGDPVAAANSILTGTTVQVGWEHSD